jgi:ribitol 2-dehydrogenase
MARELEGKVAVVTGAASGIGLASTEAMLVAFSTLVRRTSSALARVAILAGRMRIAVAESLTEMT